MQDRIHLKVTAEENQTKGPEEIPASSRHSLWPLCLVFERQVVEAFGYVGGVKNKDPVTVPFPNGAQVTTIPDLWGTNVGGLLEVKNVQKLSMSNQLRAQIKVASDTGQPLNIVVSPSTKNVSEELIRQVRSTGGDVYRYNPATGDLTKF